MHVTWFAPFFLVQLLYACRGEREWGKATIFASFFQAASPVLVTLGGRISGLQPAYALIPIGILHFVSTSLRSKKTRKDELNPSYPEFFIFALTVIGIAGAVLLPLVFDGLVHVTTPRLNFSVALLHLSSGNLVQAFYLACNFVLFTLFTRSLRRDMLRLSECIDTLATVTILAAALGIYQITSRLLNLPWLAPVINSNLGSTQLFDERTDGVVKTIGVTTRMSATFLEPSLMSVYFLGMFALFGLGIQRRLIGVILIFCLLISTSTTAVIGLLVLIPFFLFWQTLRLGVHIRYLTIAIMVGTGVMVCAMSYSLNPSSNSPLRFLDEKMSSDSGQTRSGLDALAMQTLGESYGLGVGFGSTRSSSIVTTVAACGGLPGLICIVGFFATLLASAIRTSSSEISALGLALGATIIGWAISAPDITLSIIWILSGIIAGSLRAAHNR
jgi:hypothetical protein